MAQASSITVPPGSQGFLFRFPIVGGMLPPLWGGTKGGGLGLQGGGMTRNVDATTICIMHDIIYNQYHTLCMLRRLLRTLYLINIMKMLRSYLISIQTYSIVS